ncbi:MAG: hypothetical protein ABI894_02265 [Ilumatobacteraceae bacterium]
MIIAGGDVCFYTSRPAAVIVDVNAVDRELEVVGRVPDCEEPMNDQGDLRPIERRMLKLSEAGADDIEIAWRFRRTPRSVRQVIAFSQLPRPAASPASPGGLRPIERCVLRWRDEGAEFADLAARFRRGPAFLEQVEQLARYKLAQ